MTSELYKSNPGVSIPPPQQNTGNNIITDQQCSTPTKLTNLSQFNGKSSSKKKCPKGLVNTII